VPEWSEALAALLHEDAEDLYEHAPCGYLSLLPDGLIGKVNTTFLEWTGFDRAALVGHRRFIDLLTAGGRIYYETHFQPLLRMQGFVREIAFDLARPSGSRLSVLVNAAQHDYEGAGVITRISVFDATDRRRYERELLEARRRAEEAARARNELIAMISHDVRSPLSAMTMAIALLEMSSPTPEQLKYIRVLQSSASNALGLVDNVLDASRVGSGHATLREQPFAIRELAEEVATAARAAAIRKPDVSVTVHVDESVPDRLIGDRAKIGQVIANLMMNAVKFTHEGYVALTVAAGESNAAAATLEVSVSDSGIGIPADRLPHIFDEFTQASDDIARTYGGTGLGLAICRKLLRLYRTDLDVSSTVNRGTTFSFELTLKRPVESAE
jgi:PAS domain S-box-containing protein